MTSRLKRKLGDLGVDLHSRKVNENFCLIGTPLPPLEKSKDTGEFVPLWKQEVRDEKGRKRLHGAFTGGFSAGYFNTVGSKEGWTPSTFVSSRADRAKKQAYQPEDFMDEEDLQDLRESRTLVSTNEQMDLTAGTQGQLGSTGLENDPIAAALQSSFHSPAKDSAGARILRKMGWRPGQGIGPRVSLKERKLEDAQAFDPYSGLKNAGGSLSIPDDDEEANKHSYPRRDTPILIIPRKDNYHGLGYKSGLTLNESLGVQQAKDSSGPRISAGFGLGALNDADEDDLEIYEDVGASKNRVAFDHLDHDRDDTIVIGGKSERAQKAKPRPPAVTQTFHDGIPVLPGFTLSDKPVVEDQWYPGPEVPPGWKPDPRRVWNKDPNKENLQKPSGKQPGSHRVEISAVERGTILGESTAPAEKRSIFDFMSEKDKERIQRIATVGVGAFIEASKPQITIPTTAPHIAQSALRGFQPFTADPAKQARYTAYLESQANPDSSAPQLQPLLGQDIERFNKELEDYAKAAQLFKPISGAMAGRFTSASVIELGPKIHEGLHQPSAAELAEKEEEKKREAEEAEANVSPKVHAAMMGMYGPMTRETVPWQPARLLCKRFGVKDPDFVAEEVAQGSRTSPSFQAAASEEAAEASGSAFAAASTSGETASGKAGSEPRKLENIGLGEDETQGADILTYERPSMDIFKAIFASDEEDSEEEKDDSKEDEEDEGNPPVVNPPTTNGTNKPEMSGPVDLATFKPTFVPREGKAKAKQDGEKSGGKKDKKDKKKKEKKGILVSFELDEEGGEPNFGNPSKERERERPKKKRKEKEKRTEGENDEGMFVDRPQGESEPKSLNTSVPSAATKAEVPKADAVQQANVPKSRKRAIDFLDD